MSGPQRPAGPLRAGGPQSTVPPRLLPAAGRRGGGARRLAGGILARAAAGPVLPSVIPGSRTLALPLGLVLIVDVSGSMGGTDPRRQSHQAALAICDWLHDHSGNRDDRIALVRFADRADLIPSTVAVDARGALEAAFNAGADVGGGTRLAPAVDKACEALDGSPGRRVAVLITDGQVGESDAALALLLARLAEASDGVYLLALDHDQGWSNQTHHRYAHVPLAATIVIGALTPGHLACAVAEILIGETGLMIDGSG